MEEAECVGTVSDIGSDIRREGKWPFSVPFTVWWRGGARADKKAKKTDSLDVERFWEAFPKKLFSANFSLD